MRLRSVPIIPNIPPTPIYPYTQDPITFDDVAGVDEAKEELREIVVRGRGLQRPGLGSPVQ